MPSKSRCAKRPISFFPSSPSCPAGFPRPGLFVCRLVRVDFMLALYHHFVQWEKEGAWPPDLFLFDYFPPTCPLLWPDFFLKKVLLFILASSCLCKIKPADGDYAKRMTTVPRRVHRSSSFFPISSPMARPASHGRAASFLALNGGDGKHGCCPSVPYTHAPAAAALSAFTSPSRMLAYVPC